MAFKILKIGIPIVVFFALLVMGWQVVDTGNVGVLRTWGQADLTNPIPEGGHWIVPIAQQITPMSIQIQKYVSSAESASKDLQVVNTEVTVNYHLLADKVPYIYQNLGISYEDRIINPAIEETVKQVTAQYNAEELITKRPQVKSGIEDAITQRLQINDIIVDHISITEFQFSPEFNKEIEAKVTAEQKALTAQNKVAEFEAVARQVEAQAKGEANAKIAKAEGEAQATRLAGDAEAYKLNVIGQALRDNPDLLTMENIQRWNGVLPYFYSGGEVESPQLLLNVASQQTPKQP